jgi:hypothetical protein
MNDENKEEHESEITDEMVAEATHIITKIMEDLGADAESETAFLNHPNLGLEQEPVVDPQNKEALAAALRAEPFVVFEMHPLAQHLAEMANRLLPHDETVELAVEAHYKIPDNFKASFIQADRHHEGTIIIERLN